MNQSKPQKAPQTASLSSKAEAASVKQTPPQTSPWPALVLPEEAAIPEGAVVQWVENQGLKLRCAHFPALKAPAQGTVCLVQGRAEFIEKYYETIQELQTRGFAVLAFDFRGQGGSDRLLIQGGYGHVDAFADYVSDLEAVLTQELLPEYPGPFFALCHSMGAAVMLHCLQKGCRIFERIIFTAPFTGLYGTTRRQKTIARTVRILNALGLAERTIPFVRIKGYDARYFEGNLLTSDKARFEKIARLQQKAPFLTTGNPTIGWLHALFQAMDWFEEPYHGHTNQTPILIIASGCDRIVALESIEKLCEEMRSAWFILIPGARHEILQERDGFREQFWAAFDAFIPGANSAHSLSGSSAK